MTHILTIMDVPSDYATLRKYHRPSPGYELSFDTSFSRVGHSNNSNLYYNIGTKNRLATKVNNTEWLKNRKKCCFPREFGV